MRIQFDRPRFAKQVKRIMELRDLRWELVEARSGVSHGTLSRILKGEARNIEAILSVAAALNIDIGGYIINNGERVIDRIVV